MNHLRYRQDNDDALPGPTIYRLASERRYAEVPIHVKAKPQDIYWADRYGSTALHILCCSRQIGHSLWRAIDSILALDPTLVGRPNEASWTPLHLACEKRLLWRTNVATGDLVLKMILACPDAVTMQLQTGYRAKTPFHIACETNAVVEVLRGMLKVAPSLAVQKYVKDNERSGIGSRRSKSETPFELLWNAQLNDQRPEGLEECLEKMGVLLRAAFCGTIMDGNNFARDPFPIVCAVCSVRCPRDYVGRILTIHREDIATPNPENGLLPLHYAINSADEEDTSAYTSFLIELLVQEYPAAAMKPFKSGSKVFPLHVLIADRGMTWHKGGVQHLALAATEVLTMADPRSGLVPALESAVDAYQSRLHLSTTYELLRLAPQVLQSGFASAEFSIHRSQGKTS